MFQTKFVEKSKSHIMCSVTFVENRAVYKITWKNIAQLTIWRMHIACWIPNATNTHTPVL